MAKADPPATQQTVARHRSAARDQGGDVGERSKFTPASLMSPEELVVKHAETTRKLHLTQTGELRAKETLLETQARLAVEQERRVIAEAELAEKTAKTAWLDEVERLFKQEKIDNYFPDLAKKYVGGEIDLNGFAHLFTKNLAVNTVGSRGNSYDLALKEHLGILRDSHSPVELLNTLRLWVPVPARQAILRYQHANEEAGTVDIGIRANGIKTYTDRT